MTDAGFWAWEDDGTPIVSPSDSNGFILGYLTVAGDMQTVTNDLFTQGVPFFVFIPTSYATLGNSQVSFSGSTMTVDATAGAHGTLHYGVK